MCQYGDVIHVDDVIGDHLNRIRTAVLKRHTAASISKWITEYTQYAGRPYSFKNHEFQEVFLKDTSRDVVVPKCAQVGISEASARMALALVNVLRPYTVAYTLPTAHFAGTFAKTRMDPVIEGSKEMSRNVHKTNNNSEVKQFGDSFLYIRGAASSNAPISIPVDHLVHDEYDFSDQEVLGQYLSRLGHSQWQRRTLFSTPTLPNFGISQAFSESRRHFNFCKCEHCNHQFIPDYYTHVKIPGYSGDLKDIDKRKLIKVRFQEAKLHCPSCGKVPSLQLEHREWVCENPSENFIAAGYQITPFDAPNVIKIPYLIEIAPSFTRQQDFVNFKLGLAMEDKNATLTDEDFDGLFINSEASSSTVNVMGVDCGNTYHFCIAAVDAFDLMHVIHTEQVPMNKARERYNALRVQFRVVCTVIDSMPHAETVMALQELDVNLYASVYMKSKSILTHKVIERPAVDEEGKAFVRQVNVNRSKALDGYMEFIRAKRLTIKDSEEKSTIISHHKDMKRVQTYDTESNEMTYTWQKSTGIDHYHHTFLYAWIASQIRGVGKSLIALPLFGLMSFRNTSF